VVCEAAGLQRGLHLDAARLLRLDGLHSYCPWGSLLALLADTSPQCNGGATPSSRESSAATRFSLADPGLVTSFRALARGSSAVGTLGERKSYDYETAERIFRRDIAVIALT